MGLRNWMNRCVYGANPEEVQRIDAAMDACLRQLCARPWDLKLLREHHDLRLRRVLTGSLPKRPSVKCTVAFAKLVGAYERMAIPMGEAEGTLKALRLIAQLKNRDEGLDKGQWEEVERWLKRRVKVMLGR